MDFNYESPITKIKQEITSQIVKTEEKELTYEIKKAIGYSIEKEELIKALQYDREQYEKGYHDGYNANKWIPVKERLPEDSGDYIVWIEPDGEKPFVSIEEIDCDGMVKKWNTIYASKIKAWMPLPKPYKAESEVEE